MSTTKDKTLDDLRAEVGNHLDDARKHLREASKIADKMGMRQTHHHVLMALAHVDDARSLLAESE